LTNTQRKASWAAGIYTYCTAQYRKDWEYMGLFREIVTHLSADQDLVMREMCLKRPIDTPPEICVYHQHHPSGSVLTGPGFIYRTEAQARLLEPAEEEK
jgi:hypothetical protein